RGDLDRAFRDEHVRPEVAEGARARDGAAERDEPVEGSGVVPSLEAVVAEGRLAEIVDRAHREAARLAVALLHPRPVAGRAPPPAAERRSAHDPDLRHAVDDEP